MPLDQGWLDNFLSNYNPPQPNVQQGPNFWQDYPTLNPGQHNQISFVGPEGINTGLIPGYFDIPAYNFDQLQHNLFNIGGGGGGGGGGNNNLTIDPTSAQGYLDNLFGNIGNVSQLDPALLGQISGIQGNFGGNYDQFNQTLSQLGSQYLGEVGGNDLISALLGQIGNAGSGGGGYSFGGGSIGAVPRFDPGTIRTALPDLSPELAAELDQITQSQLADFQNQRQQDQGQLLAQLFGRGVQRSTVAGEAGNRLLESQDRTRLAILSEAVQRELGVRKDEADRILQADLGTLQTRGQAYGSRVSALASMYGSRAAAGASYAGSQAALQGARLSALANIYGSRVGALGSLFNTQAGSLTNAFGTQQGGLSNFANLYGNLALGSQGNITNAYLGAGNIAQQLLSSAAQQQTANRQISAGNSAQARQDYLNFLNFQESVASRFQQGLMGQGGWDLQRELAQLQADTSRYGARNSGGGGGSDIWGNIVNALGTAAVASFTAGSAAGSDEQLKESIRPFIKKSISAKAVSQITPITFAYKAYPDIEFTGVSAQEIQKIFPEAVMKNKNGFLMVNYGLLAAALINGYKELVREVGYV